MYVSASEIGFVSVLPEFGHKLTGTPAVQLRFVLSVKPPIHLHLQSSRHIALVQIKARVSLLTGCIPAYRHTVSDTQDIDSPVRPSDLSVSCCFFADGESLSLPSRTRPKQADLEGCEWQEWLQFYVKASSVALAA